MTLDTYDSDYDDISNAQAVLMAIISNFGSDVILEVPHSETYLNYMENQSVHAMQDFEQTTAVDVSDNEIHIDSNIILRESIKMAKKDKDPEAIKQNISNKPIDYVKLNNLYKDFRKRFVPQQELLADETLWYHMLNPSTKSSDALPVEIKSPKEIPKVSLVIESLKKLKLHHANFDKVDIFNVFNRDLLNKIMEVQTAFDQMEAVVQHTTQNAHEIPELFAFKIPELFALEISELFAFSDLKAQLHDKHSITCKLKDIIKSLREKSKEENVNYDYGEIVTKSVELENSVAKLISKNEGLCNEINHVKQVFKEQFDLIKKIRVRSKEHSDALIDKLNLKFAKNEDLKAQIQDKVFVITSLNY
nr:hypothetical protein [Tanacetum cinerariifolium]